MSFLISDAWAQAQSAGAGATMMSLLPMLLIFAVFYFLLIRPQQRRQKEHREMVAALQKGDEVLTNGGILGKVTSVSDTYVGLNIAEGMEIKLQRASVAQVLPKGTLKSV